MPEPSACERACLRAGRSHKGPIYVAGSLQCFQTQPSHVFLTATPPPLASCQQRRAFRRCPPLGSPRTRGSGWPWSVPGQHRTRWGGCGARALRSLLPGAGLARRTPAARRCSSRPPQLVSIWVARRAAAGVGTRVLGPKRGPPLPPSHASLLGARAAPPALASARESGELWRWAGRVLGFLMGCRPRHTPQGQPAGPCLGCSPRSRLRGWHCAHSWTRSDPWHRSAALPGGCASREVDLPAPLPGPPRHRVSRRLEFAGGQC